MKIGMNKNKYNFNTQYQRNHTEFLNSCLDWEKNGTNKSQHQNNKTNKIMLALGEKKIQ